MENKRGLFHQAHKGSLFLDEIGDMPLPLQANLLLPLEQKAVRRVGSVETEEVDIRFISATDRDLVSAMGEGRFRDQLYHRLRECEIFIPSLRERKEDIQHIAEHYLKKHNAEMDDNKTIAPAAMDYLTEFQWPGNVRELVSVLRVALQTLGSDQLEISDIERILKRSPTTPGSKNVTPSDDVVSPRAAAPSQPAEATNGDDSVGLSDDRSLKDDLARVDQLKVEKTLERTNGNVSKSAAILGVSRETLHNKIRKYDIDVKAYRKK